jgi:hypothetical protein
MVRSNEFGRELIIYVRSGPVATPFLWLRAAVGAAAACPVSRFRLGSVNGSPAHADLPFVSASHCVDGHLEVRALQSHGTDGYRVGALVDAAHRSLPAAAIPSRDLEPSLSVPCQSPAISCAHRVPPESVASAPSHSILFLLIRDPSLRGYALPSTPHLLYWRGGIISVTALLG